MNIITVTGAEHLETLKKDIPHLLVDFWKDKCMNCKMLELSFQKLAQTTPDMLSGITLAKLKLEDIGEAIFHAHDVRQAPTLVRFHHGTESARHSGFIPPEKIQSLLT